MSLYYDWGVACDFKPDTPDTIIEMLNYLTGSITQLPNSIPDNSFFEKYYFLKSGFVITYFSIKIIMACTHFLSLYENDHFKSN